MTPLSPFLYSILMTVVLWDAEREVPQHPASEGCHIHVSDVLYADDATLVHDCPSALEDFLKAVVEIGSRYGLEMH